MKIFEKNTNFFVKCGKLIYPCPVSKEEGMNRERLITTLWEEKNEN